MRFNVNQMLNEPITLFMCIRAKDGNTQQDMYHARVLSGTWSVQSSNDTDATGTQTISQYIRVHIPRDVAKYVTYPQMVQQLDDTSVYSVGENDMLLRGNFRSVPLTKTQLNALVKSQPKTNTCKVSHVRDLTGTQGNTETIGWQGSRGVSRFAAATYIEGV